MVQASQYWSLPDSDCAVQHGWYVSTAGSDKTQCDQGCLAEGHARSEAMRVPCSDVAIQRIATAQVHAVRPCKVYPTQDCKAQREKIMTC